MAHHFFHGFLKPLMFSGATKATAPGHERFSQCLLFAIPFLLFEILWPFFYIALKSKSHTLQLQQPPPFQQGKLLRLGETGRCPPLAVSRYVTRYSPTLRWAKDPGGFENRSTGDGFTGVHWFTWKLACCNWINGSFTWEFTRFTWMYIHICVYMYIYILNSTQNPWFLNQVFPKRNFRIVLIRG